MVDFNVYLLKLRSLSFYVISSFVISIIGILVNPFLSLGLSADDYAVIGYYGSFATLLTPLLTLQMNTYYSKKYYELDDVQKERLKNIIISFYLLFGLLSFVVFSGIYYFYHINSNISIPLFPYFILSFFPLYFISIYNFYILNLRLNNQALKFARISIINALTIAILSVIFVYYFDYGIYGRLIPILLVAVIAFIYSLIKLKVKIEISYVHLKPVLIFSLPVFATAVLSYFFIGVDRIYLSRLDNLNELGLYNVGIQISGYIAIFGTAIYQAFEPDLFKSISVNNKRKLFIVVFGIFILTLFPNIVFIFIAKYVIYILTAGRYLESSSYAIILCLKNVCMTLAFLMSTIVVAYGYPHMDFMSRLFGAIITICLYSILIGRYGYYGAAWGQVLSWLLMSFFSLLILLYIKEKKR